MRVSLRLSILVLAGVVGTLGSPALAKPIDTSEGEARTGTALDGFENPPNADKSEWGYVNPCLGHEGFEAHVSRRTGLVKNDVDKMSVDIDGDVMKFGASGEPGGSIGYTMVVDDTFEVEYIEWETGCAATEDAPTYQFEPGTARRYWIKRPTQGSIVPNLVVEVVGRLPAPDIVWPNVDPEFGWIYVNIDNDVRIEPVEAARAEATVSNLAGSAVVWVEASPSRVRFEPGEPDSRGIECSYEAATSPVILKRATSCYYKYANSSAISTTADSAFVARTSVLWEITASDALTYSNPLSWREELIQVAEVQALVIANP